MLFPLIHLIFITWMTWMVRIWNRSDPKPCLQESSSPNSHGAKASLEAAEILWGSLRKDDEKMPTYIKEIIYSEASLIWFQSF
jgi:hypothetical protein